jgi:hypothetical protein
LGITVASTFVILDVYVRTSSKEVKLLLLHFCPALYMLFGIFHFYAELSKRDTFYKVSDFIFMTYALLKKSCSEHYSL